MSPSWKQSLARIRAALIRHGRTAHDADDIVQQSCLNLQAYSRHTPVAEREGFLMRTAINLSINAHHHRVRRGPEVALDDVDIVDPAPSVEALLLARQRLARLDLCLNRLDPTTRRLFLAYRLDGLSYAQLGRTCGLSAKTVERHVHKASAAVASWMEGW